MLEKLKEMLAIKELTKDMSFEERHSLAIGMIPPIVKNGKMPRWDKVKNKVIIQVIALVHYLLAMESL